MRIDLNCDCGESFGPWSMGDDAGVLPIVSSANVACGAHAGDPDTMRQTVRRALALGVEVGAHPGFPDLVGFGRRVLPLTPFQIANSVLAQVGALAAIARAEGLGLAHVKLHGALYNHAAVTPPVARAIAEAIAAFDARLILVALAGSALEAAGRNAGLLVAREAFVDRSYEADGTLRARHFDDAIILDYERNLAQALTIIRENQVMSYDRARVVVQAETLCFHGDTPNATKRAAFVRRGLSEAGVEVVPMSRLVSL